MYGQIKFFDADNYSTVPKNHGLFSFPVEYETEFNNSCLQGVLQNVGRVCSYFASQNHRRFVIVNWPALRCEINTTAVPSQHPCSVQTVNSSAYVILNLSLVFILKFLLVPFQRFLFRLSPRPIYTAMKILILVNSAG